MISSTFFRASRPFLTSADVSPAVLASTFGSFVTYTSATGYAGTDELTYTIEDGNGVARGVVSVNQFAKRVTFAGFGLTHKE